MSVVPARSVGSMVVLLSGSGGNDRETIPRRSLHRTTNLGRREGRMAGFIPYLGVTRGRPMVGLGAQCGWWNQPSFPTATHADRVALDVTSRQSNDRDPWFEPP